VHHFLFKDYFFYKETAHYLHYLYKKKNKKNNRIVHIRELGHTFSLLSILAQYGCYHFIQVDAAY